MIPWKDVIELNKKIKAEDPEFKPDPWQKKVLEHEGDMAIRTGRQVGKSVTIGSKSQTAAVEYDNITILMIAAAQRQSSEIFQKTLAHAWKLHYAVIEAHGKWKPRPSYSAKRNQEAKRVYEAEHGIFDGLPTRTEFNLKNRTRVLSLPTGKSGAFIRAYTVDILVPDEAAFIPEPVWVAVKPMLAVSKKMKGLGWTWMLSTPFGRGGYYYECCHDPDFLQIHVSSENCPRIDRNFLLKEKRRMSKMEYAQEYLGEFVAEFNQFFPTELIKARMTFIEWDYKQMYEPSRKYFLGLDIARYGEDENAFVIAELQKNNKLMIVKVETTERKSLTDTVGRVMVLNKMFHFNRIFTDDGGLGAGVTDMLIERLGKRRVYGINNSSKTVDENKKKGILKEDLYSHALTLMERNKIDIIANLSLQRSLKGMTFEYSSRANLKIYGKYSHLSEAFVRACWAIKAKNLKLFAY